MKTPSLLKLVAIVVALVCTASGQLTTIAHDVHDNRNEDFSNKSSYTAANLRTLRADAPCTLTLTATHVGKEGKHPANLNNVYYSYTTTSALTLKAGDTVQEGWTETGSYDASGTPVYPWRADISTYVISNLTAITPNRAPSASISAASSSITTAQSTVITFSASDPDGNLASWRFRRDDNPGAGWSSASGSSAGPGQYTFSGSVGTHTFVVEVTDAAGLSDSSSVTITVTQPQAPTQKSSQSVSISPASKTITAGESVSFSASGGEGSGAWHWSGASGSGTSASQSFPTPGTYSVSVYKDGDASFNTSNTASSTITVNAPASSGGSGDSGTTPPQKASQSVSISPASKTITAGESVSFSASGGAGSGAWHWSGASGSGTSASQSFPTPGTYSVSVYKDGDASYNASNTASSSVTVNAPVSSGGGTTTPDPEPDPEPEPEPEQPAMLAQTVSISPSSSSITAGTSVTFSASGGAGSGAWNWQSSTGAAAPGNVKAWTVPFLTAGSHTVRVAKAGDSQYYPSDYAVATINVTTTAAGITGTVEMPATISRPPSGSKALQITLRAAYSTGAAKLRSYRWKATNSAGATLSALSGWFNFQETTEEVYIEDGYWESILVSPAYTEQVWVSTGTERRVVQLGDGNDGPVWDNSMGMWWWGQWQYVETGYYKDVYHPAEYADGDWIDTSYWDTRTVVQDVSSAVRTHVVSVAASTALGPITATFDVKDVNGNTATFSGSSVVIDAVTPLTLTLGGSKSYDGTTAPTGATATLSAGSLASGDTLAVTYSSTSSPNVGSYTGLANAKISTSSGADNTSAYTVTYNGSYTITPAAVTFSIAPTSFNYDGNPHGPTITPSVAGATFSTTGTPSASTVGNYTVTAAGTGNFAGSSGAVPWNILQVSYTLTTNASGPGSVTPGGVYNAGNGVSISPTPGPSGRFVGWSGDASGLANPLLVTMDRDKTITGLFAAKLPQSITFEPAASVRLNESGTASLVLTATATSGLPVRFTLLGGPATLIGSTLSFTGDGAVSVQADQDGDALFAPAQSVVRTITSVMAASLKQQQYPDELGDKKKPGSNMVRDR